MPSLQKYTNLADKTHTTAMQGTKAKKKCAKTPLFKNFKTQLKEFYKHKKRKKNELKELCANG